MTVAEFITFVEVKLNRIDTSSYEDVRPEEIIFFANDALKSLTLAFDIGAYSQLLDKDAILVYLASLTLHRPEFAVTDNNFALEQSVFKFKGMQAYVEVDDEKGWQPSLIRDNINEPLREYSPFDKSFPDKPEFRLIENKVVFSVEGFNVTKAKYDYLRYPVEITEGGADLVYPFMEELEDRTVTLILENLEASRLRTQPTVSRT